MTLDRVEMLYDDGESRRMVNRRSGKAAYCCRTHSVTDDDGRPVRRYELVRPTRIERHREDLFLETLWEEASAEEFASLWSTEVRSEEHTSELQSLMRISYAVFCLKKKK